MRLHSTGITRFVDHRLPETPARWAIIASWNRCSHLCADAPAPFHRVADAELARRLERNAALVEAASPRLRTLLRHFPARCSVAYVTDADGVVLAADGDAEHLRLFCLMPGYDWSEARMGTNGAGTCLIAGRPMVVAGREHLLRALEERTCIAAPIRHADGRIAGALDLSSPAPHGRDQRLEQVTEAALEIESQLRRS
ncbi:MAG TPA: GAF domain-containing protein [Usitatibacter sp.]|nr:GAF domain-containing protein [Usitatibacter sp.]